MSWNIKTPGDYINGPLTVAGATSIGGGVSLTTGSSNHFLKEGTGWIWTSTGTVGGTVRGGMYSINTGLLNLFGGSTIAGHLQIDSTGAVGVNTAPYGSAKVAIVGPTSVNTSNYIGVSTWAAQFVGASNGASSGISLLSYSGSGLPAPGSLHVVPVADYRSALVATFSADASGAGYFAVNQFNPVGSSTTERFRVNRNGAVVLGGGTVDANGVGITFPAAQSASTDANTLDDYEEGTWTATLRGATSEPANLGQVAGRYTKIGRQVTVHAAFENVDTTGYAGAIRISGLPFANSSIRTMGAAGTFTGATFSETQIIALTASDTVLEFMDIRSNLSWTASTHNPGAGRYFWATLTYTVA